MHRIITIGREFGSGGRELGRRLAENLGIAYYDSEIIKEIAKKTPFSEEYINEVSESEPIPLFPIHYGNSLSLVNDPSLDMALDIFSAQSAILREMALKSDCVIIGRAADYVLRDFEPFRIFVYADVKSKLRRCKGRLEKEEKLSDRQLLRKMKRLDKKRKRYYEFYSGRVWGAKESYDLLVNTSNQDIKEVARVLAHLFLDEAKGK